MPFTRSQRRQATEGDDAAPRRFWDSRMSKLLRDDPRIKERIITLQNHSYNTFDVLLTYVERCVLEQKPEDYRRLLKDFRQQLKQKPVDDLREHPIDILMRDYAAKLRKHEDYKVIRDTMLERALSVIDVETTGSNAGELLKEYFLCDKRGLNDRLMLAIMVTGEMIVECFWGREIELAADIFLSAVDVLMPDTKQLMMASLGYADTTLTVISPELVSRWLMEYEILIHPMRKCANLCQEDAPLYLLAARQPILPRPIIARSQQQSRESESSAESEPMDVVTSKGTVTRGSKKYSAQSAIEFATSGRERRKSASSSRVASSRSSLSTERAPRITRKTAPRISHSLLKKSSKNAKHMQTSRRSTSLPQGSSKKNVGSLTESPQKNARRTMPRQKRIGFKMYTLSSSSSSLEIPASHQISYDTLPPPNYIVEPDFTAREDIDPIADFPWLERDSTLGTGTGIDHHADVSWVEQEVRAAENSVTRVTSYAVLSSYFVNRMRRKECAAFLKIFKPPRHFEDQELLEAVTDYGNAITRTSEYKELVQRFFQPLSHSFNPANDFEEWIEHFILPAGIPVDFDRIMIVALMACELVENLFKKGDENAGIAVFKAALNSYQRNETRRTTVEAGWRLLKCFKEKLVNRSDFTLFAPREGR